RPKTRTGFRPWIETLEDRTVPSTLSLPNLANLSLQPQAGAAHAHHGHGGHHHHQSPSVIIVSPTNSSQSPRFAQLTGRISNGHGSWPVVLIHPQMKGEPWYVQPQVVTVQKDGTFTTPIYVGNAKTPPGTRFDIVVVLAKNKQDAAKLFPVETMLKSLPSNLPASPTVVVSRGTAPAPGTAPL